MASALPLLLVAFILVPIAPAQQQDGRCDVTRQVLTYTACTECFVNRLLSCPTGTVQNSTGQGLDDCTFRVLIFARRGCRHACLSTVVTEQKCCNGYWGTNCDPCPGVNEPDGIECSGHGNCSSGINGSGLCTCEDSFNGTNCELCSDEDVFGPECDSACTCMYGECNNGPTGDGRCQPNTCEEGFVGDDCESETNTTACANSTCGENAYCIEDPDGNISCICIPDYDFDPNNDTGCIAIDHCELGTHNCDDNATCDYTEPNQYNCICDEGFTGDGVFCQAIDPCQTNNGNCSENSSCIYEGPGLSSCECLEGYENISVGCSPVNPCEDGTANCSALANCSYVSPGIARCICPSGYILRDGECYGSLLERLQDINEFTDYEINTFLSLIEEHGLADLLDRGGIFTVFAPTDAAFEQAMLTFDEATTLLAHIIPAEVTANVSIPTNYVTLAGHVVKVYNNNYTIVDSTVSAGIIEFDLLAFNGLINILDDVAVIPESARPINASDNGSAWDLINSWDTLSTFSSLIERANMIDDFGFSDLTVLAPTNKAFEALELGAISYLQSPIGINDLITIINNHIVNEELSITDIVMQRTLITAENNSYPITLNANGSISLGAVQLILNNIPVSNGMVHVIDTVLKPPELDPIVNRTCPSRREDTFVTTCGSCVNIPNCAPQYERSSISICFYFFFIGCRRTCSRTIVTPQCCEGFYGTDCLPCPENHASPCNGNGQCQDGIDGDGTCVCNSTFDGTTCELCAEQDMFGADCTENCTCINGICDDGPMGSGQCLPGSCDVGFTGDDCDVGVPHCGFLNSTCHLRATCQLINNSTEMCTCRRGYQGDGIISCQPINRCQNPDRGGCHDQASCTYIGPGESSCTCNAGWSGDGTSCVVIDPCTLPFRGGCDANAVCRFTAPGENTCSCNFGYRGDGTSCTAINSCEINRGNCHPQATCTYSGPGINNCTCNTGYIGDGYNCIGDLLTEIANNPDVSMFYGLLQQSHLEALLSLSQTSDTNYTVFVPSNMAVADASADQYALWTEEHALPLFIQHHLVAGKYGLVNLTNYRGSLPTLLADDVLTVTNVPVNGTNIVHINTAAIVNVNGTFAQNGIYHIIDELLFPNEAHLPTEPPLIVDLLSNLTNFTMLVELINRFNLTDVLNGNTFTILAPTDDAFYDLSDEEFNNLTSNVLHYHLYPGSLPVESIYKGLQVYSQLEDTDRWTFNVDNNSMITVNGVPLVGDDYHASNSSIVLPITGVLQPIRNRCDLRNMSTVFGFCGSCIIPRTCPGETTFVELDRTCRYTISIFGFVLRLRGCRSVCERVDITPRCCDDFYGPDCEACPQVDGDICSDRGTCNDTVTGNGECSCIGNYSGTACETCLPGMYGEECDRVCNCSSNGYCSEGVDGDGSCFCLPGWQGDNCDTLVNSTICNSTCHEFAYCVEDDGTCVCNEGYTGNGTYCSVIDVCADNGGCDPLATCVSDPAAAGGRTCTCLPGRHTGDGIVCLPLDPCVAANNGGCDRNAYCIPTGPGLRICACNAGYTGDGVRICDPINACNLTLNGGCGENAYCMSTGPAQRKCFCNENYIGDGFTCRGTLRQLITVHPSLTTLNTYLNRLNSNGQPIGRFLNDDGDFTGFVISDAGYQALMDSASNDTLDLFSNPDALEKLIQYSFVGCTFLPLQSLENVTTLTSLMGSSLRVTNTSTGVMVNNVSVNITSAVNLYAVNGIIHIIDTAIMPPTSELVVGDSSDSLPVVLGTNGFTYLQRGIQMAGSSIVQQLFNPSQAPFTIFSPVDDAFDPQLLAFFIGLFQPSGRPRLLNFVRYHMVSGAMLSPSDLSDITHLVTLQGGVIRIQCNQGDLFINGNRVVLRQLPFNGGVIYGIDGVLRPPGEGGDCDVATTLSTWTNCSGSCRFDCPDGYTPVSNATSQQNCDIQNGTMGCRQLCIGSSFERHCCDDYYGSDCTACPSISNAICSGIVPCDEGINGTGCNCPAPYSGEVCEGCIDRYTRSGTSCVAVTTSSSLSTTSTSFALTTTTSSPSPSISFSSPTIPSSSSMLSSTMTSSPGMSSSTMTSSPSMSSSTITSSSSMLSSTMSSSTMTSSPSMSSSTITSSSSMLSSTMTSSPSMSSSTSMLSSTMTLSPSMSSSTMTSSTMTSSPSMSSSTMTSSPSMSSSTMTSSPSILSSTITSSPRMSSSTMTSSLSMSSSTITSSPSMSSSPRMSSPTITSSPRMSSSTMTSSPSMTSSLTDNSTSPTSTSTVSSSSTTTPSQLNTIGIVSQLSSSMTTTLSPTSVSTNNSINVVQTAGASAAQKSDNTAGMAVGISIGVVVLIVIIIIVIIVIGVYVYSRRRGYFSFKDRMTYKTNEDGIILTMDESSPSPVAYNNPIYSGEGDDSFFESGDDYMNNPIYDGIDDEL